MIVAALASAPVDVFGSAGPELLPEKEEGTEALKQVQLRSSFQCAHACCTHN